MIEPQVIDAFNTRLTVDLNSIKSMTVTQQDQVKVSGSQAEALLKNRDMALFIHQYKFELLDQLASLQGHTSDNNSQRVAIANQLAGIDGFIASLKRMVYFKNRVVTLQNPSVAPTHNQESSYQ